MQHSPDIPFRRLGGVIDHTRCLTCLSPASQSVLLHGPVEKDKTGIVAALLQRDRVRVLRAIESLEGSVQRLMQELVAKADRLLTEPGCQVLNDEAAMASSPQHLYATFSEPTTDISLSPGNDIGYVTRPQEEDVGTFSSLDDEDLPVVVRNTWNGKTRGAACLTGTSANES